MLNFIELNPLLMVMSFLNIFLFICMIILTLIYKVFKPKSIKAEDFKPDITILAILLLMSLSVEIFLINKTKENLEAPIKTNHLVFVKEVSNLLTEKENVIANKPICNYMEFNNKIFKFQRIFNFKEEEDKYLGYYELEELNKEIKEALALIINAPNIKNKDFQVFLERLNKLNFKLEKIKKNNKEEAEKRTKKKLLEIVKDNVNNN